MDNFLSAITLTLALIALAGVGYILMSDESISDTETDSIELMKGRLNDIEQSLEELTLRSAVQSRRSNPFDSAKKEMEAADEKPEGGEIVEVTDDEKNTLMSRLETIEARIRGLEQDPVQRAYTFLKSESAELRKRGIHSLKQFARNDPEARNAIKEMLADIDAGVCAAAIISLTDINAKDAAEDIAAYIDDDNDHVRSRAVDAMGRLGYKGATDALLYALGDENGGVRREAIFSLGEIGVKETLPQLREFYRSITAEGVVERKDSRDHRYILAHAMKRLGDPEMARNEIVNLGNKVFNSTKKHERLGAVKGILWLGRDEPVAREIFKKLTNDPVEWIRREAQRVLNPEQKR